MTCLRYIAVVLLCLARLCAQENENRPDLSNMSVEDLMNLQVTTAGKIEQKLSQIPSAVYVITAEDIRRSGFTSVPEALRLAPGVEVAQINSSTWAIAIHGFNSRYANKLLVLVDGRTVYSSTFTQVFWSVEDLALEDVERIEVIRGPGGSVWGANAVEGAYRQTIPGRSSFGHRRQS
jgi:iron complex outermembrane receptor protein